MTKARSAPAVAWFDATDVLTWGPEPPMGVPRVEQAIYRYCRTQPDLGIAIYDSYFRRFRPADRATIAYLDYLVAGDWPGSSRPRAERRVEALRFWWPLLSCQNHATADYVARCLSGKKDRKNPANKAIRTIVRPLGWLLALVSMTGEFARWLLAKTGLGSPARLFAAGVPVLMSNTIANRQETRGSMRLWRQRPVYLLHDIIPLRFPEQIDDHVVAAQLRYIRRIMASGDPVITISKATRDDLLNWYRQDSGIGYPHSITAVSLGATIDDSGDATAPIPALQDRRFAIYCSTIDIRKRHDVVVRAWAALARKHGAETLPYLAFSGRAGSGCEQLSAALEDAPEIANRVVILDLITDAQLRWAYRNAEFGVFPSSAEGWGLGVSECLAHGVPVVHSDIPALCEAAQGLMPKAPTGDIAAWVSVTEGFVTDPRKLAALRDTIGRAYRPGKPDDFARNIMAKLREFAGSTS
ncbi:glycosyltransferase [Oricola sp.]|uniref:glycosyltransferase n=1 Tax=Oricola sp. TaxID=1979950 RepID=UPI003BA92DA6